MLCLNAFRRLSRCLSQPLTLWSPVNALRVQAFHKTCANFELMEFFDDKKNWGESEVKTGRAWRKDELRIKSNEDLHKLWFVLYKERNMLMTMEEASKDVLEPLPSPERIDKVEESMKNLEIVVRERNKAYWELEVGEGETGERPFRHRRDIFGRLRKIGCSEHLVPYQMNTKWRALNSPCWDKYVKDFTFRLREKMIDRKKRRIVRQQMWARGLLSRFPDLDIDYLEEQMPEANVRREREHLEERLQMYRKQKFRSAYHSRKED